MDFIPDVEYHGIFERTNQRVILKGAKTPEEVNKRLMLAIKGDRSARRYPTMSRKSIEFLRRIVPSFGRRTIDEAIANPHGLEALTLKFGRERARRILLKQGLDGIDYLRKLEKRKKKRR